MTEAELVHLRKEILLLGELQMKYKEKLQRIPSTMAEKQEALLVQAFEEQITAMEATVVAKSAELEATRAKMGDLEQNVAKKERVHQSSQVKISAQLFSTSTFVSTSAKLLT